jgi:hypothetical protein
MVEVLDAEKCKSIVYCVPWISTREESEETGILKGVLSESFVIGSPAGDCSPLEALELMATEPDNADTLVYVESIACAIACSIKNRHNFIEGSYIIRI